MALGLALVAGGCNGLDTPATETEEPSERPVEPEEAAPDDYCAAGGDSELVWVHDQITESMHFGEVGVQPPVTSWIMRALWEGPYGVAADMTFFPKLIETEEIVPEGDGWRYTFTLRDGLTWSDGTPLTADHVQGTYRIMMEGYDHDRSQGGVYHHPSRELAGYHLIDPDSWQVDELTYSFATSEFYAGYQTWFDPVMPTHVIADAAAANQALVDWEIDGAFLPSSGPMLWNGWTPGVSASLLRNDEYHGMSPHNPDVENLGIACVRGVRVDFVADADALINSLLAGEADMIMTQPQIAFGAWIAEDDDYTITSTPGPVWEHWGMNLHNEHLSDPDVREALAVAMDKRVVVDQLYRQLYDDLLSPLGNAYWMTNQPAYVDHAGEAGFGVGDGDRAAALLDRAGYQLNADEFWEHPDRGVLTLRVGTTGGSLLRETQQELLRDQLRGLGFDIRIDNVPGAAYFGERPMSDEAMACATSEGVRGDCSIWDLTQFAWVGGPWPSLMHHAFLSRSPNNPYGYANPVFDARTLDCDRTVDEAERAACYNELSRYVTTRDVDPEGLVILPIVQKPAFYAYSNDRLLRGAVAPEANATGPLANVVDVLPAP